jgi:hypothetical protein
MRALTITLISLVLLGFSNLLSQERQELVEKRTYFSKTFLNSDDSYSVELSTGPVHFRNENGKFEEINRNIVSSSLADFDYEVTKGLYHVYFKSDLSESYPVAFETKGGSGLLIKPWGVGYLDISTKNYEILQQTQPTIAATSHNEIMYENAYSGVDIKYIYTDKKLKEEIYFSQSARSNLPNPSNYNMNFANTYLVFISKIDIDMPTTQPYVANTSIKNIEYEGEDRINFKSVKGDLKFFFPVDKAFLESERDSVVIENAINIRKRIINVNENKFLLSGIPLSWVNNQSDGTIIFDPQVEILQPDSTSGCDSWVYYIQNQSSYANNNYGSLEYLHITAFTKSGSPTRSRAFLKFDLSVIPPGCTINSAYLEGFWHNLFTVYSSGYHGGGDSTRWSQSSTYVRRVTENWSDTTITWNNQPDYTTDNQASVSAPSSGTDSFYVDVANMVEDMITYDNYGFIWMLQTEYQYRSVNLGSSDHASEPARRPKLTINYSVPALTTYYIRDASGQVIATYQK